MYRRLLVGLTLALALVGVSYAVVIHYVTLETQTSPGNSNKTRAEYVEFVDDIYSGYFTNRYDDAEGWFEADSTGADGDGYTADVPFSYINAGFLDYAGIKANQGTLDATTKARVNSVIDKMFISPVWVAGQDLTRSLECRGSVGAPTCAAGSSFSAASMADRSDIFTTEAYVGAYLLWLNWQSAGIGATRRDILKSFIDDTINISANGYNQGDLMTRPMHQYLKHLAGTSQVSNFSTMAGSVSGWGLRFDTAAQTLPYVTDAYAWNYRQDLAQTDTGNFQTLEYLGFINGTAPYEAMVEEGSTRNSTADARLRAVGLRLMAYIGHAGWPTGWLTQYGSSRQDLPGYALGFVNAGLDSVMSNSTLFSLRERRWAKWLFDTGIDTFVRMDTYGGDAADGMVGPEPFSAATTSQEQDGDKAVGAAHIFRAIAWHILLGNDTLESEQPPNLAWYDWQQNSLVVSTPTYATFDYADVEGTYSFGLNSTTYETSSGSENIGMLTYVPTNEHVIERADENQVSALTSSSYSWRRLEHGLLIFPGGAGNFVLDEDSGQTPAYGHLRPLMKTDSFSVRGWGVSGSDSSKRPATNWPPTWKDGELKSITTIDRTDDTDAGFDDYQDVVTKTYHDTFIEESHEITAPAGGSGACTTCFAYYLLRPPNNGQAYITHAGRIYDSTSTIPVRYELQNDTLTDWSPTTITKTGTLTRNDVDGNGCVNANDGCTGAGTPAAGAACCTAANNGTCWSDSAGGVVFNNLQKGSLRGGSGVTYTLTHSIDTDMGVTASADNRVSYQVIGRRYTTSPNFNVTLDGGTLRSKSASAGAGDTLPNDCLSAGEIASDYQATIYNSSSDDASTIMTAGSHTVLFTSATASNIYADAFQVTSQSPARFLDNETAGGWVPPGSTPGTDNSVCTASGVPYTCCSGAGAGTCFNDWYLELRDSDATSGYIAWFPDKTLLTKGIEARYVRKPSSSTSYNNDPPSVVGLKLYGNNYGKQDISFAYTTVPAFNFAVEYYPYNGDHHEANRIWEQVIKWRPRVRAFTTTSATLIVSVNEIGIDLSPQSKINFNVICDPPNASAAGFDASGCPNVASSYTVTVDAAADDFTIRRSDTTASGLKVSWNVIK